MADRRRRLGIGVGIGVWALLAGVAVGAPLESEPARHPPVEEGSDTGNDLNLPPVPPHPDSRRGAPATPHFGFTIEDPALYVGQSTCDPVAKPGALALRSMLLGAYPGTGDLGITRACGGTDRSEHKEGRAFDWKVSALDPQQKATADRAIAWLLATDEHGHRFARARRLGIMYIIWNRRIWLAFQSGDGWLPYKKSNPHTDHVHFSLSWEGARKQTTWWDPDRTFGSIAAAPVGSRTDFDADGRDDTFLYGPGEGNDRVRWGTPRSSSPTVTDVAVAGTFRPVAGDFNGDEADDIVWYAPGTARDYIWTGTPGTRAFTPGRTTVNGDYRPVSGDFDADGVDDIVWYGPGTLPDFAWWSEGPGSLGHTDGALSVGGVYDALAGDLDGDGADDILWYGHGSLPDAVWLGTPGQHGFRSRPFTANGTYRPFIGDFDGDGIDDIFWYGPGGTWGAVQWGAADLHGPQTSKVVRGRYVPIVGDHDGNQADDIVWYQPGTASDSRWWAALEERRFENATDSIVGAYLAF